MKTQSLKQKSRWLFFLKVLATLVLSLVLLLSALLLISTETLWFVDYEPSQLLVESSNQKGEKVAFYLRRRAMTSDSVLGVYQKGNKTKKIIFLYPTSNVSVKWLDEETLAFSWTNYRTNETCDKSINVHKETYDWRDYSQS